jgi:hypothetical protein
MPKHRQPASARPRRSQHLDPLDVRTPRGPKSATRRSPRGSNPWVTLRLAPAGRLAEARRLPVSSRLVGRPTPVPAPSTTLRAETRLVASIAGSRSFPATRRPSRARAPHRSAACSHGPADPSRLRPSTSARPVDSRAEARPPSRSAVAAPDSGEPFPPPVPRPTEVERCAGSGRFPPVSRPRPRLRRAARGPKPAGGTASSRPPCPVTCRLPRHPPPRRSTMLGCGLYRYAGPASRPLLAGRRPDRSPLARWSAATTPSGNEPAACRVRTGTEVPVWSLPPARSPVPRPRPPRQPGSPVPKHGCRAAVAAGTRSDPNDLAPLAPTCRSMRSHPGSGVLTNRTISTAFRLPPSGPKSFRWVVSRGCSSWRRTVSPAGRASPKRRSAGRLAGSAGHETGQSSDCLASRPRSPHPRRARGPKPVRLAVPRRTLQK